MKKYMEGRERERERERENEEEYGRKGQRERDGREWEQ